MFLEYLPSPLCRNSSAHFHQTFLLSVRFYIQHFLNLERKGYCKHLFSHTATIHAQHIISLQLIQVKLR